MHVLASIFLHSTTKSAVLRLSCGVSVFVMAEKQGHSCSRDFHGGFSKLVCPVSLVSLLICTAALVRVEIINQRVRDVEVLVADARQNQNLIKVSTDRRNVKRSESVEEIGYKITKERRDETEGNGCVLLLHGFRPLWFDTARNCCGSRRH